MSRMPDDLKSKYNHDNKFKWVDSQLEKFMDRQKELEDKIKELENELSEIRQDVFNLPNNFELGSKIRERFNYGTK